MLQNNVGVQSNNSFLQVRSFVAAAEQILNACPELIEGFRMTAARFERRRQSGEGVETFKAAELENQPFYTYF